jgi:hypothetical protein
MAELGGGRSFVATPFRTCQAKLLSYYFLARLKPPEVSSGVLVIYAPANLDLVSPLEHPHNTVMRTNCSSQLDIDISPHPANAMWVERVAKSLF